MVRSWIKAGALATMTTLAVVHGAAAQSPLTLKISHGYPESHFLWQQGGKVFVDTLTAATKGAIRFEVYPANQLGKEQYGVLASGLADFAVVTPSIAGGKLPLTSVTELPGLYQSSCEATGKFWSVVKPGGALNDAEYKPNGLHPVYVTTVPPYSLMTVSKETPTLESLQGLKVRVAGGAMNKTVSALGAVPVQVAGPEMYDALSRGTVDAAIYSRMALNAFKLEPLLKYSVDGIRLGSGSIIMLASNRTWSRLTDEQKEAVAAAGRAAQKHLCEYQDAQEAEVSKDLVEKTGWKILKLSPEQAKLWSDRVAETNRTWAAELDGSGRPGSAILEAFRAAKPEL